MSCPLNRRLANRRLAMGDWEWRTRRWYTGPGRMVCGWAKLFEAWALGHFFLLYFFCIRRIGGPLKFPWQPRRAAPTDSESKPPAVVGLRPSPARRADLLLSHPGYKPTSSHSSLLPRHFLVLANLALQPSTNPTRSSGPAIKSTSRKQTKNSRLRSPAFDPSAHDLFQPPRRTVLGGVVCFARSSFPAGKSS